MISSIGSSSQTDITSLLQSNSNAQKTQGRKPPSAEDMLKEMDTDGDGSVSETELTESMEKMKKNEGAQPPPPPPAGEQPSTEEMFSKIDSDGDGKITLAELQADMESRKAEQPEQSEQGLDVSELFGKLDSDSDGQIGESEFAKLFEAMDKLRENQTGTTYTNGNSGSSSQSTTSLLGYA